RVLVLEPVDGGRLAGILRVGAFGLRRGLRAGAGPEDGDDEVAGGGTVVRPGGVEDVVAVVVGRAVGGGRPVGLVGGVERDQGLGHRLAVVRQPAVDLVHGFLARPARTAGRQRDRDEEERADSAWGQRTPSGGGRESMRAGPTIVNWGGRPTAR